MNISNHKDFDTQSIKALQGEIGELNWEIERITKINQELVNALERWKDLNSQLHVATFGLKELTNNLIEANKKSVTPES